MDEQEFKVEEKPDFSIEDAYNSRIAPLIEQIAAFAHEYEMNFVFGAQVGREMGRPAVISSAVLFIDCPRQLLDVKNVLFEGYRVIPPPEDEL